MTKIMGHFLKETKKNSKKKKKLKSGDKKEVLTTFKI